MRKFIRFQDNTVIELSPLSYSEFMALDKWSGSSDMAYEDWLRHNGYADLQDYDQEEVARASFSLSLEPISPYRFEFSSDNETWKPLDLNQYKEKEIVYLDHAVENGTVVVIQEDALDGNEPMMIAMLARDRIEIQLGIRASPRVMYGRVNEGGKVFLPGLGLYEPHAFRVTRLLEKEENGYFKED